MSFKQTIDYINLVSVNFTDNYIKLVIANTNIENFKRTCNKQRKNREEKNIEETKSNFKLTKVK